MQIESFSHQTHEWCELCEKLVYIFVSTWLTLLRAMFSATNLNPPLIELFERIWFSTNQKKFYYCQAQSTKLDFLNRICVFQVYYCSEWKFQSKSLSFQAEKNLSEYNRVSMLNRPWKKSNFAFTIWKGLSKRWFCRIFRSLSAIFNE